MIDLQAISLFLCRINDKKIVDGEIVDIRQKKAAGPYERWQLIYGGW